MGGGSGQRGNQGPAGSEALSTGLCAEMGSLEDSAGRGGYNLAHSQMAVLRTEWGDRQKPEDQTGGSLQKSRSEMIVAQTEVVRVRVYF